MKIYPQEPVTIKLGGTHKWKKRKIGHRLVKVNDTFQYVPLLDSLKVQKRTKIYKYTNIYIFLGIVKKGCNGTGSHRSCE